ncbi:MAG: helix-turn-helix domain-containing protein [Sulfurifustis sp.]
MPGLTSRPIAAGDGWSIREFICRLGPADRPFEEQHMQAAISAVLEGSFQYRCATGDALLHPGSFLLGDAGTCYECGHTHGSGDRCIAFHFEPSLFEEIAASAAGSHRFRFPTAMVPATRALAAPLVETVAAVKSGRGGALGELAMRLAETVLGVVSGAATNTAAPAPRDQRRIAEVLRYIETHAEQPLELSDLAAMAFMSKYHFLRTFRRTVGVTPYQFVLGVRMRRAAIRLRTTPLPVATIAADAGFGDLSTFNSQFRELFGRSPQAFRKSV